MARYQFWDGVSDVYTPGRDKDTGRNHYTAEEWRERYPWVNIPGVKMVLSGGIMNGGFCMEFGNMRDNAILRGAAITDDMTDDEVLAAIEDFEDNPPGADEPTVEERIASALEYQNMLTLEDVE